VSGSARKRLVFHGRVQGVGFRAFAQEAALQLGARGWVRNRADGAVEMEAEADASVIEQLILRLQTRHPWARVDRVESMDMLPRGNDAEGFHVAT
jgi:acylphosphatase